MELKKILFLAKRYDLVVGDCFQLFFRGIICVMDPYHFYIKVTCKKGLLYKRYYTYTPKPGDEGDYEFKVELFDDYHRLVEEGTSTLHVVSAVKPSSQKTILCFGDSLTFNGVWPNEAHRHFCHEGGSPLGLNMGDCLRFVGGMQKEDTGYEGFGGWKWKEFCTDDYIGPTSNVWVTCDHNKTEHDQHSIWETKGKKWVLESIDEGRLKFKRGEGNWSIAREIGDKFTHVDGGINHEDIIVKSFDYSEVSPFYDATIKGPNFKGYCEKHGYADLDYVYILLSWNGQWIPFNNDFSNHDPYIRMILDRIHNDFPKCKVGLIGIQSPSVTGGISANYGCTGPYSDMLGEMVTAYQYDEYLENLCLEDQYKDFVRYIDMKAQFDVEYSMPYMEKVVNTRSEVKELIGTNAVHPSMNGYLQISDAFFRALVADLSDHEPKEEK